ncbi:MurR/RpiR family transcriptional regulator [Paracoccus sp. KR1-242]|uniref:MurR/RpiR family transcriptional regulator n=1 Tax=Paracoccus sp. KR1-242 TaxID=3410028 RepID=UPI003C0294A2
MDDLKKMIEANWAQFTANQQRVGEFVLSNPFLVATMGIEDLAQAAEVSAPTITRFVRVLGLSGYADFRAIAVRRYQDLLQPIENVSRASQRPSAEVMQDSLAALQQNISMLAADCPVDKCEALVDRMVAADKVGFLGFGRAARALAYFAGSAEHFLRSCEILDGAGGYERLASAIGRMGPRDLVIAMSLPRYSVATLDFLRLARARGVPCVGITDSESSPIFQLCDQTFIVPARQPVLNSSGLAAIALFEALVALMTSRYQSASDAAALTRLIFPYLYADGPQASAPAPKEPK